MREVTEHVFEPTFPHSVAVRLHELVIRVHSNDPQFLSTVARVFYDVVDRGEASDCPHSDVEYRAWIDRRLNAERKHFLFCVGQEEAVIITPFFPAVIPALERDLVNSLPHRCPDIVLLGAACVAVGDTGILLIGEDRNEQSRLARDLVQGGFGYYADRYSLIRRADSRALPCRKGITIERLRHPLLTRVRRLMPFRGVTMNTVTYTHPGTGAAAFPSEPITIDHVFELRPSSSRAAQIESLPTRNFGLLVSNADCGERMDRASFDLLHQMAARARFHTLTPGLGRSTLAAMLNTVNGHREGASA